MTDAPPFTLTDAEEEAVWMSLAGTDEDLTEIEREAMEDGEAWWSDREQAPLLPGDLVSHLPATERSAAVEYQRLGLPYYPSDPDGL